VKTTRKNGRKWSNISVKKYHHRPVFGVNSGKVSLGSNQIQMNGRAKKGKSYVAPQVCGIHCVPPVIVVDIMARILVYNRYLQRRGMIRLRLAARGCGDAR
jgi:hypothetical protein